MNRPHPQFQGHAPCSLRSSPFFTPARRPGLVVRRHASAENAESQTRGPSCPLTVKRTGGRPSATHHELIAPPGVHHFRHLPRSPEHCNPAPRLAHPALPPGLVLFHVTSCVLDSDACAGPLLPTLKTGGARTLWEWRVVRPVPRCYRYKDAPRTPHHRVRRGAGGRGWRGGGGRGPGAPGSGGGAGGKRGVRRAFRVADEWAEVHGRAVQVRVWWSFLPAVVAVLSVWSAWWCV